MQLKRLTIYGYGKFHDRTFDLTPGLNVLVGPNEAGKSTITQFITAILFGFPTKKHPELRYEPLDGSQFGGEMVLCQAGVDYLVRRVDGPKGGKVTLTNLTTDSPLPPENLNRLLAPVDEQLFSQVYSINEPRLSEVFAASKQVMVERLRHVGAVGSDYWLQQAAQQEKAAEALYKPLGRNPRLNQQLREHAELSAKLAKANAAYDTYWSLLQERQSLLQRQKQQRVKLDQQRQVSEQLAHLASLWPTFDQWQRLQKTTVQPTSGFGQTDLTELERLTGQVKAATTGNATLQHSLEKAQVQADLPANFQQYVTVATRADPLLAQLPQQRQLVTAHEQLRQTQQGLQQRMAVIEQQVANADGTMPRSFPLSVAHDVTRWQAELVKATQKRRRLQQELNQLNEQFRQVQPTSRKRTNPLADKQVGWLAAGLIILVGAMLLPAAPFKLAGALLGMAIGYYGVFIVDSATPASRQLQGITDDIRDTQAQLREGGQRIDQLTSQLDEIGSTYGLDNLPVEQWDAAQAAIHEWDQLTEQLETVTDQLTTGTDQQMAFQQSVGTLFPDLIHRPTAAVLDELTAIDQTRHQLSTRDDELTSLMNQLKQSQTALQAAERDQQVFLQTRNVRSPQAFYERYEANREFHNQQVQQMALAHQLGTAAITQLQHYQSQTSLQTAVQAAQTELQGAQQALDASTSQLATIAGQLDHLTASGTQSTLRQKLANLEAQMQVNAQSWLVHQLVSQWIKATLAAASGDRLPQILQRASVFYGKLTSNRYTEISLTESDLRVRLATGEWRQVSQLSRGTAEQLDLAVKLAFAVVMNERVQMPLVIDDGLVNFDAQRRQAAIQVLIDLSDQLQILLLTADEPAIRSVSGNIIRLMD
ncbi:DNA repair ATPase [Levilactobacillus senmaizukei DSM 21775 = NBRC 103853]|uniref:DNA repair ATPase n=1 Tax=Levilactobacillus senmaizukei DSM 21775 = NBRC 103853 TaxID=1423803 RepID=A0A0R2DGI1_9LACO|nr:AAA family ATPase [Levilactobacillus senmaizukei]KRN02107.1 DNA repair ATPase [Levilactobacillus senmaizukei DSM 21775 = NBRC 103853]